MLSFLISSSVIASVPKSEQKGVKPVALDTVVLWTRLLLAIHQPICLSFDQISIF
jgi:hypothetical protein